MLRRGWLRTLRLGLPTVLGIAKRGFFIPCRYARLAGEVEPGYPALEPIFRAAEPAFGHMLGRMEHYAEPLAAIGAEPPPQPRWRQQWFPRLDGAAAYTLVRERSPRRIVEVGCGHSTRFFARAIADGGLAAELVAIDPAPRAAIESLPVRLIRAPMQRAGDEAFAALGSGDILAIDSSHILMPGTDVDVLFNRVLPALPTGVLVHIHDVFLPDGYPRPWAWRGYNEQLAVAALIQGGYRLLWSSRYVATRMAGRLRDHVVARLELVDGAFEASVWLEKADRNARNWVANEDVDGRDKHGHDEGIRRRLGHHVLRHAPTCSGHPRGPWMAATSAAMTKACLRRRGIILPSCPDLFGASTRNRGWPR